MEVIMAVQRDTADDGAAFQIVAVTATVKSERCIGSINGSDKSRGSAESDAGHIREAEINKIFRSVPDRSSAGVSAQSGGAGVLIHDQRA